ncbi:hypothetical protein K9L16_02045 [Candidatus Pacearchaeota archaeon]|nr:hypothetical protein [Candidatus Pacearchaeota archaeon]
MGNYEPSERQKILNESFIRQGGVYTNKDTLTHEQEIALKRIDKFVKKYIKEETLSPEDSFKKCNRLYRILEKISDHTTNKHFKEKIRSNMDNLYFRIAGDFLELVKKKPLEQISLDGGME